MIGLKTGKRIMLKHMLKHTHKTLRVTSQMVQYSMLDIKDQLIIQVLSHIQKHMKDHT